MAESKGVRQRGKPPRDPSSNAPAGISLDVIGATALAIVRRAGVDGLSMRTLADELGVRAPSLYHHVASKGQLLDLVARQAFESFRSDGRPYEQVTGIAEWIALVRANSFAVLDFYRAHPGLAAAIVFEGDPHRDHPAPRQPRDEVEALVRLGVTRRVAREVVDAAARWTVAAVAADGSAHSSRRRENKLFRDGLELLLLGLDTRLRIEIGAHGS